MLLKLDNLKRQSKGGITEIVRAVGFETNRAISARRQTRFSN